MCPSNECWDYDHDTKTCTPIQNETCSVLVCGYDGITASFDNNLFGISSGKEVDQVWGSINTPSWQSGDNKWALSVGLGDAGVSSSTDGDKYVKLPMILFLYEIKYNNLNHVGFLKIES